MKKFLLIFFASLVLLFLSFSQVSAANCPPSGDPRATGIVPCGISCSCTITNFFMMLARIYRFIVLMIATPLAIIGLIIGAIFMMLSAGNPGVMGKGKTILYASIIGLVLVFCSWVIINFIMSTLGYNLGNWWQL